MYGLCFEGQRRWTYHFLLIIWLLLLVATPPKALGYFLGDTKAVLHGCKDHWTLQDRTAMPLLFQMTVCVDIRVTVPGAWVAFSYSSIHAPRPELGLEGDDKAVYGWLLRVRHRFPFELSPREWHRVCLRRDVPQNSFSLEVDGKMVAARTVIAQAIPPSGSLWLGCRPRDRPPGAALGEVELYMFRMWDDLDDHGVCEDGTVIGWSAQYWGLTSPRARQRDPKLLCDHRRLRRMAGGQRATAIAGGRVFTTSPVPSTTTALNPVIAILHMSNQTSQVTGRQLINCNIEELCSQRNYFWMSISVKATGSNKDQKDVHNLVLSAFGCFGDSNGKASYNMDFCQTVEVDCMVKSNISTTTCDVLLTHTGTVSACEVQRKGVSALQHQQHVKGKQMEVKIITEVERVGRYLCKDTAPPSGAFVRCTSTSSLEDICQANKTSTGTCSFIEPDSNPDLQPVSEFCSREMPRFCNCTAFCNSQRMFFATKLNITSVKVNVRLLKRLLSHQSCASQSNCQDILKYYKKVHLECHGTEQRLSSCMVILEMSRDVYNASDICSLNEILQQRLGSNADIKIDRPLTRIGICGPPELTVNTLLKSNLTWVDSDLLTSNLCPPDPTLLECEANEVRAVLLNESCHHTTQQITTKPSTLPKTSITATHEDATEQTYTEAGNAAATEKTTASHSTVQPYVTTPLAAINSTQSSTVQPALQTSSQNTTLSPVNSTLQITTTALIDSTLNTTTLSPNHITVYSETTDNTLRPSPNETSTTKSNSTIGTFTPSPTMVNNVTTATKNYTTASNKFTNAYNVTTAHKNWNLNNGTTTISNTTIDTFPTSPNHTAENSVTTASSYIEPHNSTVTTTNTTISTVTSYPNYTTAKIVNTTTKNYTNRNLQNGTTTTSNATVSSFTTSPNHTADDNVTTTKSYMKQHNRTITTTNTTISTFTSSPNYTITTTTRNYTTASDYDTTDFNKTMVDSRKQQNGTTTSNATIGTSTTSPNHTVVNNYTTDNVMTAGQINRTITTNNATRSTFTPSHNYTMVNNVTTATKNYTIHFNNYTTQYNVSTANIRSLQIGTTTTINTTMSTFTPSPNHTEVYNETTTSSYVRQHNSTIITTNATMRTFTTSPNYTMMNNVTTATKNYTTAFNNYITVDNNGNQQNATTTSNTAISTYTTSPKPTVVFNATTAASNYTTQYNVTTASNSNTTKYNVMTAGNIRNLQSGTHNSTIATTNATISPFAPSPNYTMVNNVTTATKNYTIHFKNYTTQYNVSTANIRNLQIGTTTTSNTTFSTFTPSPNHTAAYNVTTTTSYVKQHNSTITTTKTTMSTFTTSNYTMASKITTATKNHTTGFTNYTTVYNTTADNNNGTITTISTFTPFPNYTTVNNATTVSHKYTTAENVSTTTVSQNKRTTYNVTTTAPHKTMTTSTAGTLNNATTSSKNSTVDIVAAVVDTTTKPTEASLNNQTANHTTARLTYITTTGKNDTNSATAANSNINHNETAGTGLNLSTTPSSLTTDLNLTTIQPVISLTATVPSTTHGPPSATTTTTTGTTSTTTTTTTSTAITTTSTTTTKPDTGPTTSTTTAKTTESQEALLEEANELLDQTQDASQLNASQVEQLAGQLEKLLDGPTVSKVVAQKTVNIISNLMEGNSQALTRSANRLIRVVDDLGLKLVINGDKEIISSTSLVLAVRTVDGTNFPMTSVDIFNTDNVQLSGVSRSRFKRSGSALGSVYLPSSLTTGLSPEEQQQASRIQFTYYTKSTLFQDQTLDNKTFVSPILGSSVANLSISNLSENIRFTIGNINSLQGNYTTSCVYWEFALNDGYGGWSSNGCSVVNATPEETTCSCNHLTSFAILLDLSREGVMDRQQAQILTFITYIGCGLSAIFLAVTLLTYLSFEKLLRDIPAKILVQLCISLLLLNLLFLLDGWLAIYPATGLCISTAFFLHYFLLTSFTWAGLEALHMYLSVIQVFTPYLSRYMLKFSLMGWGIPLIVVIIVISVDKDNYGLVTYGKHVDGPTGDFCWLRNDIAFYVSVVGYFVLIFALCLIVFIMVMVQLARIKRQNPQNQSPNRGVMTDMRSIAGLVILLGLTWGFALFAWGPLNLPFIYLFTILNTLQGFFVFVFHCAVKENVRRQWRTYLCCGKLRLAENSDWSRTATQNTKTNTHHTHSTATMSAHHLPSRSSSVISDGTNSTGSLFLDSGISDGTGSDVVLNEIHRQTMSL